MPGLSGPSPKDDEDRIRRNAPIYNKVPLRWDGIKRGPELPNRWKLCDCLGARDGAHPDIIPGRDCGMWRKLPWHPATLEWYDKWRCTPQSMVFTETDWEFFGETALLHDRYWSESDELKPSDMTSLAGELRRRQEAYGGTFESRRKLRMDIESPQHDLAKEAQVENDAKAAVDYATKLAQAAAKQKGE